jgi:tetratricopeptide (TPR) repeat protein
VRRSLARCLLLLVLFPPLTVGAQGDKVIDLRAAHPITVSTFEGLWASYMKADRAGDTENARRIFREIRRLRIERNIGNLETLGLSLVSLGLDRLGKGERDRAEELFHNAVGLSPNLPDGHLALALTDIKSGPLGIVPAVSETLSGTLARFGTVRGRYYLLGLLIPVGLLVLFATTLVFSLALLLRNGTLLLHDLEESMGPGRHRAVALAFYLALLLLPVASFQGYGWLPLWWLALLFVYFGRAEKLLTLGILVGSLAVGPLTSLLESRLLAARNPLFWDAVEAVEEGPDSRAIAELEAASKRYQGDRDLVYMLAAQYRKAGRYDDAMALYRELLRSDPNDGIAKNNLANLEFSRGEYQAAIARYKQGTETGAPPEITATFFYNLSLAHLQKFEYQPAQEAKSNADRLAPGLMAGYDRLWRYDKGDYAVVDLGLTPDQVWAKFAGTPEGVAEKNLAGRSVSGIDARTVLEGALNRFGVFLLVFALVVLLVIAWRGKKMFTMHCLRCGTAFCRRCHLGTAVTGLCTQCHHLFVVRDGVSGPARNRKLLEVQAEEERRSRMFRILSLISPGAGHLYAERTLLGITLAFLWYLVIVASLLTGRVLPVTEAPSVLARPWGLGLAAFLLVALYITANRTRPDFEVMVPIRRAQPAARPGRNS